MQSHKWCTNFDMDRRNRINIRIFANKWLNITVNQYRCNTLSMMSTFPLYLYKCFVIFDCGVFSMPWIFSVILHSNRDIQYLHRFALYKHSMHMYVSRLGYECIQFIWRTIKIRSMNLIWNNMISYGWIAITLVMVSIYSVWKYIKLSAKYENYRHFEILSVKFQLSGWFCWSSGDM